MNQKLSGQKIVIATHNSRLQVEEGLVGLAEDGAVFVGRSAKTADFGLKLAGNALALGGIVAEDLLELAALGMFGGFTIAVDAVVEGRGEGLENGRVVGGT